MTERTHEINLLLHDIRSSHNVGSIFRTADAIGVSHIYLSGYSPRPLDRFKRPVKEIAKTALGAEISVPWGYVESFEEIVLQAKNEGFSVVGLEQDSRSIDYRTYVPPMKVLFVVGSEVEGMSGSLRDHCDALIEIPMYGKKESLNVAVAFGVAAFRLFGR